jgi:hypothetical protein
MRFRAADLSRQGGTPPQTLQIPDWCGCSTEYLPVPRGDGWWSLVPIWLEYHCRRQLDPPPPASPPPPRPGTVRLRCTKTFHDPDGGLGTVRRPGEIFDTREDFVRELRAQDLAVEVEG